MGQHYSHLSLSERRNIFRWYEAKMKVPEMADRLGRSASTVYRELRRNFSAFKEEPELDGYYPVSAQDKYLKRRAIQRKMIRFPQLKTTVEESLKAGWSPEQIAGRMRLENHALRLSHETIYRFAYSRDGRAEAFHRHLPEHRRRRRPRGYRRHQRGHIFDSQCLANRPDQVAQRCEFGHWECDLVMFRKEYGKVNVTSLVERVSRYAVVMRNEDRTSKPIMNGLINSLSILPAHARRSITFDRGAEFSAWQNLKDGMGTESWFCDPQAPWQKGTVENTNKRLRRYLPRSTEPTALTNRYLRSICHRLNSTPRKCLGYRTPAEVFESQLMAIKNEMG